MKKLFLFLIVTLLVGGLGFHEVVAQMVGPDEPWRAAAYCTNEDDAKLLSRRMAEDGLTGYTQIMRTDGIACWDSRILSNVPVTQVITVEKVWRVVAAGGQMFDFWTALDQNGRLGWVWFVVAGEDT